MILLAVGSHLEWGIVPKLLFAKSAGHFPEDTAIETSRRYFWSVLRSFLSISGIVNGIGAKSVTARVSHVSRDFPIAPEKLLWGPDVFPSIFWKR